MSDKKIWIQTELTCRPLDTLEEVSLFLQDPPAWRSLCKKIIPHSPNAIRNCDLNQNFGENILETPQSFCHYEPQTEDIDVEHHDRKKLPKTLVCHDMANGYHDDSYVDGTGNSDAYTLYHWGAVDVFCYFSHHFVTVPPLGWINVAHQHGVKVLGTVITEWTSGAALWERILASEQQSQDFASALVAIAQALHFDGWLLNVENKISKPQQLLQFVRQLRQSLHRELEAPLLLWYDSVTVDGHLSWQNGLNHKNKAFFDASDGLFTNYSWSEQDVRSSAELAGERVGDLYVGVDVWGRNFYGGGQFNTQQAVQVVHKHGCSLALFAPAWTHEALSEEADDVNSVVSAQELDQYDKFLLRDRALWCSLWPFLCTKLPDHLPFQTSFCRGQGRKRRLYGEVICPVPWYNLRHMQYQPNSALGPHGYLLSTRDNILGLSRLGLLQNKTGILRCRRSLKENSKVEFAEKTNSEVLITVKTDSLTIITQEETKEVEITSNDSKSSTTKTKIIDVLRNLFRAKGTKITENKSGAMKRKLSLDAEEKQEIIDTAEEIQRKDSSENEIHEISGRSMIQMSVNLRLRDKTQKTRYALAYVSGELQCLEPFFEDSFLGGSCLKINPSDEVCTEHRHSRLFHCDFLCEESLIACVVTKKMLVNDCVMSDPPQESIVRSFISSTASIHYCRGGSGHGGLAELPHRVLLLEAGADPPQESIIPGFKDSMKGSPYDWNFTTVNDHYSSQALQDGSQRQPRGRMLGGSGSINDMIYARGFPADYDEWASTEGDNWSWANVLKYFKKTEHITDERITKFSELVEYHGFDGEIEVTGKKESTFTTEKFLEGFRELGFDIVRDMTNPNVIGAGRFSHTIRDGKRDSSLTALLNKASKRDNLFVLKDALVTKVLMEDNVANGVKVLLDNKEFHFYAEQEVIVSAGTFNTAKLLLLSGIGPKEDLKKVGIEVVKDLPVGENLHDHIMVLTYLAAENGTCYVDDKTKHLNTIKYLYDMSGSLTHTSELGAYISFNNSAKNVPDFAIYSTCMPLNSGFYDSCKRLLGFKPEICEKISSANEKYEILTLAVVNLKPKSRGKVTLQSADPLDVPLIYSGTFSDSRDLVNYPAAMRVAHSLADTSYFRSKGAFVLDLGLEECKGLRERSKRKCVARATAMSAWHAVGTAAMGLVVDNELRVKGVRGLRVVDASVMPKVIRGNTNAPVVMIAELAADFIKKRLTSA